MFSDTMILVAGADARDRELILQAIGDRCHVVAAQSVEDALAHVSDSIDLVICEFQNAQFSGEDLLRRWKAQRGTTPFLVLLRENDVAAAVDAMRSGAGNCLVKPIDREKLRAAAEGLIKSDGRGSNGSETDSLGAGRRISIDIPPDTSLEDLERAAVEQALIQHHGNRTHAARTLGISVRTLQRKLKAWGMPLVALPHSAPSSNFAMSPHANGAHFYNASHAH
jgi:DNA-binding NtrC family response regulator